MCYRKRPLNALELLKSLYPSALAGEVVFTPGIALSFIFPVSVYIVLVRLQSQPNKQIQHHFLNNNVIVGNDVSHTFNSLSALD
jgi:hypothetical protein